MAIREIIRIDEEKCNGCGECVPTCAEGAIRIIDGKARLLSDRFCDGLGACLGNCPTGAITIEKREAADFDEKAVQAARQNERQAEQAASPPPDNPRRWRRSAWRSPARQVRRPGCSPAQRPLPRQAFGKRPPRHRCHPPVLPTGPCS
jgi:NAD-dependent dihydropyrimidine dehydrogenase PreA subunit